MHGDRNDVQMLQHHMVRRLPTSAELSVRKPIGLTERDEAILSAVATHGLLTTELIELAYFSTPLPGGEGRGAPSSRAYSRLRQLWLWGYLERIELPVARVLGGRRPYLYTLTRRGMSFVSSHHKAPIAFPSPRRLDRLDDRFLEHDLRVTALWAHMQALVRVEQIRHCRWTPERDLRALGLRVRDPQINRWLTVLPDGYVELEHHNQTIQCLMVDIDMGTLTVGRFRLKLRAFQALVSSGMFQEHWHRDDCTLIVVSHSWERVKQLWKAAREEVPYDSFSRYVFAAFASLASSSVEHDAIWLTLGGTYQRLLQVGAVPCGVT